METVNLEAVAVKQETAARMLDISRTTVWRLIKAGKLDTIRIGADQRITVTSIKRLVSGETTAASLKPGRRGR